jgi:hypothetical protein
MSRILYGIEREQREMRRQLIACDPASLQTCAVPLKKGQGELLFGTFVTLDGEQSTVAGQTEGCARLVR